MSAKIVVNNVVCCLVSGLSWPCIVLPDIASAWEGVFHFSSKRSNSVFVFCALGLDVGPSSTQSTYSFQQESCYMCKQIGDTGILRRDAGAILVNKL